LYKFQQKNFKKFLVQSLMVLFSSKKRFAQGVKSNNYAGLFYPEELQLKIFGGFAGIS